MLIILANLKCTEISIKEVKKLNIFGLGNEFPTATNNVNVEVLVFKSLKLFRF